jgi:SHS family lactate transporter-like MFS transporter
MSSSPSSISLVDHFRSVIHNFRGLSGSQRHTFLAGFLGWTMDSLDFFILIF